MQYTANDGQAQQSGQQPAAALLPAACDLTAIPTEQRTDHLKQVEQLFVSHVQEIRELSDGYAFRFDVDLYPLVANFIANERLCCPFFSFVLEISPQRGPLWLQIKGGSEAKAFLQAEFGRR